MGWRMTPATEGDESTEEREGYGHCLKWAGTA